MNMKTNRSRVSGVFLIVGLAFLGIGIATENTAFSWAAVGFVLASLLLGGRWLRRRK
jgi:hypothetical protein